MFTATNRTIRFAGITFAVFMAVVVNGSMLMHFDSVATDAALAQSAQTNKVAVLETVTVVGRRI